MEPSIRSTVRLKEDQWIAKAQFLLSKLLGERKIKVGQQTVTSMRKFDLKSFYERSESSQIFH